LLSIIPVYYSCIFIICSWISNISKKLNNYGNQFTKKSVLCKFKFIDENDITWSKFSSLLFLVFILISC
jgi:hypothetical protein